MERSLIRSRRGPQPALLRPLRSFQNTQVHAWLNEKPPIGCGPALTPCKRLRL